METIIKSIGSSQSEIIKDILKLHCEGKNIDCDPTYSKGNFYKNTGIQEPLYKFDILPQQEDVIQADCRDIPLEDESLEVIMFDPPFVISKGPSLQESKEGSNIIASRFSCFENYEALISMYYDSLKEMYRLLKPKGVIIFKCQDTVSSGKQFLTHVDIARMCQEANEEDFSYYVKDIFILAAKHRITSGKWKIQRHARKYHSYFMVLVKQ